MLSKFLELKLLKRTLVATIRTEMPVIAHTHIHTHSMYNCINIDINLSVSCLFDGT